MTRAPSCIRPHAPALAACVVLGLCLVAGPAAAQEARAIEWLEVTPGLIGQGTDVTLGARVAIDFDTRHRSLGAVPWQGEGAAEADLPFTLDPDANPESLTADLRYTVLISLSTRDTGGPGGPGGPGPGLDPAMERYGFLKLGIGASAEALQRVENADLAAGATVLYTHDRDDAWALVPTAELDFGYVGCVGCDLPAAQDPGTWRLDAIVAWSLPLRALMPAPLDPLRLRPGARFFKAWGMSPALAALRDQEGVWGSIELAYTVQGVEWLHELHVGWRGGELPVRLRNENAWSVGATFVW